MKRLIALLAVMGCLAAPAYAVNPDEVLADPVLEERARDISSDLKCVVCRGENIDESNASIARDLRLLVRERLVIEALRAVSEELASVDNDSSAKALSLEIRSLLETGNSVSETALNDVVEKAQIIGIERGALLGSAYRRLDENNANAKAINFIVERYGEYVLMKPNRSGANLILWATGPVLFLIAALSGVLYLRRRAQSKDGATALTQDEEARLKELLDE